MRRFVGAVRYNAVVTAHRRTPPPPRLPGSYLVLELTNRCSLACVHCSVSEAGHPHHETTGYLDPALADALFADLAVSGARFETLILFWLGEPLIHPHFSRIWRAALRLSARHGTFRKVEVHSNATHLTARRIDAALNDAAVQQVWHFSLDAIDAETYLAVKGRDRFAQVQDNVAAFLRRKAARGARWPRPVLQFIVGSNNVASAATFRSHWEGICREAGLPVVAAAGHVPPGEEAVIFFRQLDCPTAAAQERENAVFRAEMARQGLALPAAAGARRGGAGGEPVAVLGVLEVAGHLLAGRADRLHPGQPPRQPAGEPARGAVQRAVVGRRDGRPPPARRPRGLRRAGPVRDVLHPPQPQPRRAVRGRHRRCGPLARGEGGAVMRLADLVERGLDRARLRRAPGRPTQVHLSVTDRCFLPCLHCDIWKNKDEDLPGRVWEDVIDRLAPWCAPAGMNFVGGEPLLRKDLEGLMARAVQRGFTVSFNTNGWLMTPARARGISAAGASIAYVSLDGMEPATVDHSRGRAGSFDKAVAAIELLRGLPNPRVVITVILHAHNAAEIPALLDWVRERGLQMVVQPLYQNFGDNDYDPDWWRASELWPRTQAELSAIEDALDRLTAERLRGGPVCNDAYQLQAMKLHFRHPERDTGASCRAGHSDISFDPQGRVRLCYFLEPVGTVFDATPFPVMWEALATLRRRYEVSRCERHCNLLNCNFGPEGG